MFSVPVLGCLPAIYFCINWARFCINIWCNIYKFYLDSWIFDDDNCFMTNKNRTAFIKGREVGESGLCLYLALYD